jgi:hypothetical protein
MGDKPEIGDSLVLEIFNPVIEKWEIIWSFGGMSYNQFKSLYGVDYKCVMIPVNNNDYLSDSFKFRFYNIATLTNNDFPTWIGSVDNWNIDYVYLNSGRNKNDSLPIDVAFNKSINTLLNDYTSMPWKHFIVDTLNNTLSEISIPYTNYSSVLLNLAESIVIKDITGTTIDYNSGVSASNLPANTDTFFYRNPIPYYYKTDVTKNVSFLVKFIINTSTISDIIKTNDTVSFYQNFYNYYAYDDGVPELGYALIGEDAQLAYQFNLLKPDTIHAVQFQFNNVYNNANEDYYFSLVIWGDNNGKPGNILYQEDNLRPIVNENYKFQNYSLSEPFVVSNKIYVGWIQQSNDALNLGFDRNSNNNSKIFFNTNGNWYNSMYEGSLMIRIIVGDDADPYLNINKSYINDKISVLPNPVKKYMPFEILGIEDNQNYDVKIFSVDGKLIYNNSENINKIYADFENGIYIVSISNKQKNIIINKKIVVVE